MFDIIYVTWFVHITTAFISNKFWFVYLVASITIKDTLKNTFLIHLISTRFLVMLLISLCQWPCPSLVKTRLNRLKNPKKPNQNDKPRWKKGLPREDSKLNTRDNSFNICVCIYVVYCCIVN